MNATTSSKTTASVWRIGCILLVSMGAMSQVACVSTAAQQKQDDKVTSMQSRLEDVERTNGRLTVRVEELEDQLFLVNDRVEAHRISLQRRGFMGRGALAARTPRRPNPSPESYYSSQNEDNNGVHTRRPKRAVTRISLEKKSAAVPKQVVRPKVRPAVVSKKKAKEVVYTEAQYNAFAGVQPKARHRVPSSGHTSGTKRGRVAQPDVTQERLKPSKGVAAKPTSSQPLLTKRFAPTSKTPTVKPKRGLAGYRDSLAQYRAGNYKEALVGFKAFLASKPKDDYVDNALYWIGECQYGLGNYKAAVRNFKRVVTEQPDGNKVPDSMLKMSLAYERLGKAKSAQKTLKRLTSRFPLTNAGRAGKKRLSQLAQ